MKAHVAAMRSLQPTRTMTVLVIGLIFHLVYIASVFDCYFTSPVVRGMQQFPAGWRQTDPASNTRAKRLLLFVGMYSISSTAPIRVLLSCLQLTVFVPISCLILTRSHRSRTLPEPLHLTYVTSLRLGERLVYHIRMFQPKAVQVMLRS